MTTARTRRLGRIVVFGGIAVAIASLAIVLIALPGGSPTSSDPGAPAVPWWVVLLPSAVGVALALVVPPRATPQPAVVVDRTRHAASTWALMLLAVAFLVLVAALDLGGGEGYVLTKAALLLLVPGVVVLLVRGVRIERTRGAWHWWAPAIVVAAWFVLSQLAPWNPTHDLDGIDATMLAIAATATAITAGLGEELFYRRWLQTRLEAGLGSAAGVTIATLAFALMHLGSHGTGDAVLDTARVIVAQGSFGLLMGVLWWRYRNLVAIVVAHVAVNGWPVVAHLAG